MKKLILLTIIILSSIFGYGQTYNMSNASVITCTGTFYDNGNTGNYTNSQTFTETFTPGTVGNMLQFVFTSFSVEGSPFDYLRIYNGPTTASPLIGSYSSSPGTITASNATGQLTFLWVSDGSLNYSGWVATISCVAPIVAPANDLCVNATVLPCGTVNLAGTTVGCTNIPIVSGCSMSNYGVWYTFVGDGQSTTITTNPAFDIKLSVSTGTCASMTNIVCTDASPETATFTTVLGTTYYVYIGYWSTSGSTTGTFTISRSCVAPATPPTNDACTNATALPCGTVNLAGTTVGCVSETAPLGVSSNFGVWYSFTGDGNSTTISTTAGAGFDHELLIMSGTICGAAYTQIADQDAGGSAGTETFTFTSVLGTQYYVYIAYYGTSGTSTNTGAFTISRSCVVIVPTCTDGIMNGTETGIDCGGTCPPCVAGHNIGTGSFNACSGQIFDSGGNSAVYGNSQSFTETYCSDAGNCIRVTFTSFATESGLDILTIYNGPTTASPVIGSYSGSSIPPIATSSSGCLTFKWVSDGSVTYAGWAATISCLACPVPSCTDGIQNQTETGIDCGGPCAPCPVTYTPVACSTTSYNVAVNGSVVFYDDGGPGGNPCSDGFAGHFCDCDCFTIVTFAAPVGQYLVANFREFAMFNTSNGFDWMVIYDNSTTTGTILFDNRAVGSWNGNPAGWNSTSLTTGANNPMGECGIGTNIMRYCSTGRYLTFQFWATGVVNRAGWDALITATSTQCVIALPIELISFTGHSEGVVNKLEWSTASEINNDYFTLERSEDGINFTEIGKVVGAGNSTSKLNYTFIDEKPLYGINYYILRQTDYNGDYELSNIVAIKNTLDNRVKLIRVTDVLGQDVSEEADCIKIYYYSDGSVKNKYIVK